MNIPTLSELHESIKQDLKNRLLIPTIFSKSVINVFAAIQAAKLKILYIFIKNVYDNIFVDTADEAMLERFGIVKLDRLPFPPTAGEYECSVNGTDGAVISANTTYKNIGNNELYILDNTFTFSGATETITLRALTAGTVSELESGDELQVTSPLVNVSDIAVVQSVTTQPTDGESLQDYRDKVIKSYRSEPQGGARTDYQLWALDENTVRKAYPYVKSGEAGVIDLYIEANAADSTDGIGTPTATTLTEVENVIASRVPMTVFDINYLPVQTVPIDVIISDLSDTSFIAQIKTEIQTFLRDVRPFVDGADIISERNDILYESDIVIIIRNVIGKLNTFSAVIMEVDGVQVEQYQFIENEIPYVDTVS